MGSPADATAPRCPPLAHHPTAAQGSGVRWRLSGAASRAELRRELRDCGGRGWGGAGRRGGAGAGQGGEDGLHGAGGLDGGEDAQPAATARAGEDIEIEHAVHQVLPNDGVEHGVLGVAGLIAAVRVGHALG